MNLLKEIPKIPKWFHLAGRTAMRSQLYHLVVRPAVLPADAGPVPRSPRIPRSRPLRFRVKPGPTRAQQSM